MPNEDQDGQWRAHVTDEQALAEAVCQISRDAGAGQPPQGKRVAFCVGSPQVLIRRR